MCVYEKKLEIVDRMSLPLFEEGKIHVTNSEIEHFTKNGVKFQNGKIENFDTVIFATGYTHGFEQCM